ncbi:MAG: glycosyltransferase family 2 protein [Congregibacter sp.]
MSYCIAVPHFDHLEQFRRFLPSLLDSGLPIVVVDDGSSDEQQRGLENLIKDAGDISLLVHRNNRGKGAAIITAARHARSLGHTHILQIDADGQHDATQIQRFVLESQRSPQALISGAPVFSANAPRARVQGRRVTNFFVAIETLSLGVRDSLCGFRVYPLGGLERVLERHHIAHGMGVDTDLMVKSAWENIELRFLDVDVQYLQDGLSHFDYLRDNLQLIKLHCLLLAGSLLQLPRRGLARFRRIEQQSL